MRNRQSYYWVAVFLAGSIFGALITETWEPNAARARAQADSVIQPVGFEFPSATPEIVFLCRANVAKGTVITGSWIAEDVGNVAPPNHLINSADVKFDPAHPLIDFSIRKPDKGWPKGKYRLELKVDGKVLHTERFVVG